MSRLSDPAEDWVEILKLYGGRCVGSAVRFGSTRTTMCFELSGVPTSPTIGVRHVDVAAFVKGLICRRPLG